MIKKNYSYSSPEVGKTLLQAGLWAVTGRLLPINGAGSAQADPLSFQEALLQRAIREKMVPMLDEFSRTYDLGLGDVPAQLSEVFRIISRAQYIHFRPIADELTERGIPIVLIKGADLDLAVYLQRFPRVMGDIDIWVRPPDVPLVSEVFTRHGFLQGKLDKTLLRLVPFTDAEKEELEVGSIELAEYAKLVSVPDLMPFCKIINDHLAYWRMAELQGSFYLTVGYDIHVHLSLEFDLSDVWTGLRTIDFPEVGRCFAQSFTDMMWYLAVRFYHELHLNSALVMRSFLDVLAVVSRYGQDIDWERVKYIADKYRMAPALYYTFWHINEILEGAIPESVMSALFPVTAEISRGHDWGDFIPRMLGEVQVWPILKRS